MDPRKGKANYGEAFRQNVISTIHDNQNSHRLQPNHLYNKSHNHQQQPTRHQNIIGKQDNFRIVSDPHITTGCRKVISVNGIIPGHHETVVMRDPRSRLNKLHLKKKIFELPILKFKHDEHSVGRVLPKEVSFFNLNNNIDRDFLASLCQPFGVVKEVTMWNNSTKQHLGIGSVLFSSTKSAFMCCDRLNNTPAMGKVMLVVLDTHGEMRKKKMMDINNQQQKQPLQDKSIQNKLKPPFQALQQMPKNSLENFKSPSQVNRNPTESKPFPSQSPLLQNGLESIPQASNQSLLQQQQPHKSLAKTNNNRPNQTPSTNPNNTPTTPITTATITPTTTQQTPSYSDNGYFSYQLSEASGGDSVSSNNSCGSTNNQIVEKSSTFNTDNIITKINIDDSHNNTIHNEAYKYDSNHKIHIEMSSRTEQEKESHKSNGYIKHRHSSSKEDTSKKDKYNKHINTHKHTHKYNYHGDDDITHDSHYQRDCIYNQGDDYNRYGKDLRDSHSRSLSSSYKGRFDREDFSRSDRERKSRSHKHTKVLKQAEDFVKDYGNNDYNDVYSKGYREDYSIGYSEDYGKVYNKDYGKVYNKDYGKGYIEDYGKVYTENYSQNFTEEYGQNYTEDCDKGGKRRMVDDYRESKKIKKDSFEGLGIHRKRDGKKRSKERHSKRSKYEYDNGEDDNHRQERNKSKARPCRKCKEYGKEYCKEHRNHRRSKSRGRNHVKASVIVIDDDEEEKEEVTKISSAETTKPLPEDVKLSNGVNGRSNEDKKQEINLNNNDNDVKNLKESQVSNIKYEESDVNREESLDSRIQALLNSERHNDNTKNSIQNGLKTVDDDDRMSISSGADECNLIEVTSLSQQNKKCMSTTPTPSTSHTTTAQSSYYQAPTTDQPQMTISSFYPYSYPYHHAYPPMPHFHHNPQSFYPHHHSSFYPPPFMHTHMMHSFNPNYHNSTNMSSLYKHSDDHTKADITEDNVNLNDRPEFKAVIQALTVDLQVAVSKDLRKKIVELLAFKMFDEWWDASSEKDPSLLLKKNLLTKPIKSSTLEDGGLLGFRASTALMPSFRKKRKSPTPPIEEIEDKQSISSEGDGEGNGSVSGGTAVPTTADEMEVESDDSYDDKSNDDGEEEEDEDNDSRVNHGDSDDDEEEEEEEEKSVVIRAGNRKIIRNDDDEDDDDDDNIIASNKRMKDENGVNRYISEVSDEEEDNNDGEEDDDDEDSDHQRDYDALKDNSDLSDPEDRTNRQTSDQKQRCRLFFPKSSSKPRDFHFKHTNSNEDISDNQKQQSDQENQQQLNSNSHQDENHQKQKHTHHHQDKYLLKQPMVLLTDVTNKIPLSSSILDYNKSLKSRELLRLQCSLTPSYLTVSTKLPSKTTLTSRTFEAESAILASFLNNGVDEEDARYMKKSYEQLLSADYPETYWLNETHWADHPTTQAILTPIRKGKRRDQKDEAVSPHLTGSARTEGYYKISGLDKMKYLKPILSLTGSEETGEKEEQKVEAKAKVQNMSRHARSESRRLQTLLGDDYGDVMKINRLKFRKKELKFGKSFIHDWGLYANEKIQEGELIIEYVGEVIRPSMADIREKRYEKSGIGSSYLFKIDSDTIIDATKTGNMARFINHSCNPNCSVKIITVDSLKKIVIYSKVNIEVNDEITFDYKFPIEEDKIACRCGAYNCRGTLN